MISATAAALQEAQELDPVALRKSYTLAARASIALVRLCRSSSRAFPMLTARGRRLFC